MAFYPLERLINLYDGYQRVFRVAGQSLLLIQDQGRCYLILNQCPHQLRPLEGSTVANHSISCKHHGITFDLATGNPQGGCTNGLQRVRISYEGNQLGVDL